MRQTRGNKRAFIKGNKIAEQPIDGAERKAMPYLTFLSVSTAEQGRPADPSSEKQWQSLLSSPRAYTASGAAAHSLLRSRKGDGRELP